MEMGFRLEFYETEAGDVPALEYIRRQIKDHRWKIGQALQILEETGPLARRPLVDYLGDGLYELRVIVERHQHRLLYFFHGRTVIVVTSGFLKNQAEVPEAEKVRAKRFRADWLARFGG